MVIVVAVLAVGLVAALIVVGVINQRRAAAQAEAAAARAATAAATAERDAAAVAHGKALTERDAVVAERDAEIAELREQLSRAEIVELQAQLAKSAAWDAVGWELEVRRSERHWRTSVSPGPHIEQSPVSSGPALIAALQVELDAAREEIGTVTDLVVELDDEPDPTVALMVLRVVQEFVADLARRSETVTVTVRRDTGDADVEDTDIAETTFDDTVAGDLVAGGADTDAGDIVVGDADVHEAPTGDGEGGEAGASEAQAKSTGTRGGESRDIVIAVDARDEHGERVLPSTEGLAAPGITVTDDGLRITANS